ncbi:MAG: hypothetical protein HOO01_07440, partial [Cellvibrionales bacterium]|nr:hypothetical protein [Cellvibrionales bacterium]
LKLLDRKHYEMHPSWLSFAVKLTAFLVTFFTVAQRSLRSAQRATRRVSEANHKVTGMSGHPDGLD